MAEYLQQFKALTDQLAVSGSPLSDDDLQVCVLDDLPSEFRPLTSSIRARAIILPLSTEELFSLLIREDMSVTEDYNK